MKQQLTITVIALLLLTSTRASLAQVEIGTPVPGLSPFSYDSLRADTPTSEAYRPFGYSHDGSDSMVGAPPARQPAFPFEAPPMPPGVGVQQHAAGAVNYNAPVAAVSGVAQPRFREMRQQVQQQQQVPQQQAVPQDVHEVKTVQDLPDAHEVVHGATMVTPKLVETLSTTRVHVEDTGKATKTVEMEDEEEKHHHSHKHKHAHHAKHHKKADPEAAMPQDDAEEHRFRAKSKSKSKAHAKADDEEEDDDEESTEDEEEEEEDSDDAESAEDEEESDDSGDDESTEGEEKATEEDSDEAASDEDESSSESATETLSLSEAQKKELHKCRSSGKDHCVVSFAPSDISWKTKTVPRGSLTTESSSEGSESGEESSEEASAEENYSENSEIAAAQKAYYAKKAEIEKDEHWVHKVRNIIIDYRNKLANVQATLHQKKAALRSEHAAIMQMIKRDRNAKLQKELEAAMGALNKLQQTHNSLSGRIQELYKTKNGLRSTISRIQRALGRDPQAPKDGSVDFPRFAERHAANEQAKEFFSSLMEMLAKKSTTTAPQDAVTEAPAAVPEAKAPEPHHATFKDTVAKLEPVKYSLGAADVAPSVRRDLLEQQFQKTMSETEDNMRDLE